MSGQPTTYLTPEEYLTFEREAEDKNEYIDGEVLSDSTERYDRGKKFALYRTIESLAEYVLVAQDERRVEQYAKQPDGRWLLSDNRSPEDVVESASVRCAVALRDVYEKVTLPPGDLDEGEL